MTPFIVTLLTTANRRCRQDFTYVCPTEIIAFSDRSGEFEKINTQVIGAPAPLAVLSVH